MNTTTGYRLALPVGLLLLVLCSTGLALECYQCSGWMNGQCASKQTCASGENSCMVASQTDVGLKFYSCRPYDKCTANSIRDEFNFNEVSLSVACCQSGLCNKAFTGLPAISLIFFSAAALLVFFS